MIYHIINKERILKMKRLIALILAMVLLLCGCAGKETAQTPAAPAPAETTAAAIEETTEPTIPCRSIALTGGMAELNREGQFYLLNVKVTPEDTTDILTYTSEDESVATVTVDGRVTAVAEGETTIYITCGKQQINCPVVVRYVEETEPPTEETEPVILSVPVNLSTKLISEPEDFIAISAAITALS